MTLYKKRKGEEKKERKEKERKEKGNKNKNKNNKYINEKDGVGKKERKKEKKKKKMLLRIINYFNCNDSKIYRSHEIRSSYIDTFDIKPHVHSQQHDSTRP